MDTRRPPTQRVPDFVESELPEENLAIRAKKIKALEQELNELRGGEKGRAAPKPPDNVITMYSSIMEALDESSSLQQILFERFGEFTREEESSPLAIASTDSLQGASSFRYKLDTVLGTILTQNMRLSYFLSRIDVP